jgi:hypothetical protein
VVGQALSGLVDTSNLWQICVRLVDQRYQSQEGKPKGQDHQTYAGRDFLQTSLTFHRVTLHWRWGLELRSTYHKTNGLVLHCDLSAIDRLKARWE